MNSLLRRKEKILMRFTEEELRIAKSVDLCAVASGINRPADREVPHLKGNGFHPDL